MYISHETAQQTRERLGRVIRAAEWAVHPGTYAFLESPVDDFPADQAARALALVRDDAVWSALVPCNDPARERFAVFSFHFQPDLDNSGFVGWLASHLKAAVGTGVFVVCGQNTRRGGIFDYWGVPVEAADAVLAEVRRLRGVTP